MLNRQLLVADIIKELTQGKTVKAIATSIGVNRETIYSRLRAAGIHDTQQFKFDHNFFEVPDTEEKAYWLGFIMADGCVSMTANAKVVIKLAIVDEGHIVKWHKAIRSTKKPCVYMDDGRQYIASTHPSMKMCNDLIKLGCVPRKSLILQFPQIRQGLLNHFVRGYMDGDGSIGKTRLRLNFIGTKKFLTELQKVIGVNKNMRKIGNNKRNHALNIDGPVEAMRILDWIYDGATIYLDRKYAIYQKHKRNTMR